VEVLVVKTVRGGHSASSSPSTRPLSLGSSGTDSLIRSASAAATRGSVVVVMRPSAESRASAGMIPSLTSPSA